MNEAVLPGFRVRSVAAPHSAASVRVGAGHVRDDMR